MPNIVEEDQRRIKAYPCAITAASALVESREKSGDKIAVEEI